MDWIRVTVVALVFGCGLEAETGYDAWLRYQPTGEPYTLPAVVSVAADSEVIRAAREELIRGVRGMFGRTLRAEEGPAHEPAITLGPLDPSLPEDGYRLRTTASGLRISASNDRGILYGVFGLLRKLALRQTTASLDETEKPGAAIRWVNEWDNLDGSIERGYGGRSIFFDAGNVRADLSRIRDYARLLASLGINGCAVNNVNANPRAITTEFLPQLARIAEVFRPWGVRLAVSIDLGSPHTVGGLDTFDPADPRVARWWKEKTDEIYRAIPDLGGFLMKADSEGRVGPSAYGRTHAEAANVVARALQPHGGVIFYRSFVYDHHMDWRNLKNDRARAAYDNFHLLDGRFEANAIVQIKHGPIDFQVREPASPLFDGLHKTRQAIELQITQEYFGQARHLVFLVPMWKDALGQIVTRQQRGFVGVSNIGLDANWSGYQLSQANLYGFGRLAWNSALTSRQIAQEWTRLTFGHDPAVVETVVAMQLASWRNYENYTGPLGAQTLTDITGSHYGPAVEASERNGWGQWHRADEHGIGMDRTVATGTGYIGQYPPEVARRYESLATCPDELLLFMHHVPYTYRLHSGKTVIQHIYDSHYEGAAAAEGYVGQWKTLAGRIDEGRYREVLAKLEYQAGHAEVWRDAVCNWFLRKSGIADTKGRAGHFPGRVEAESMHLEGYAVVDVEPWEAASGGQAVECDGTCSAGFRFAGKAGWYDIDVRYFDQNNGVSQFRLWVGAQELDEWKADDTLPARKINAHSSTRRRVSGVALRPGDEIRIVGTADGAEHAALDYVEIRDSRPQSAHGSR